MLICAFICSTCYEIIVFFHHIYESLPDLTLIFSSQLL